MYCAGAKPLPFFFRLSYLVLSVESNLCCCVLVSATNKANAVERMRNKCEQKTTTAVTQATLSLSHDLKMSQRLGSALQSKLNQAKVHLYFPLTILRTLHL